MSNTAKEYFRYLHVSPTDKLWGLHVTGLGSAAVGAGESYPPTVHPSD